MGNVDLPVIAKSYLINIKSNHPYPGISFSGELPIISYHITQKGWIRLLGFQTRKKYFERSRKENFFIKFSNAQRPSQQI
ncbi:hypothetical protein ACJJI4_18245 [Microbulbifer sp. TRSA002]|uniref:hypothetical protein n=1 Tax=Microbulbifer sp. TRSA002 TaxID=3243382 RepID=UPI0040399C30